MKRAFTMAEILISLTIIGIVAAITLPALTSNLNEKTWNTQRKALHARMAQALGTIPQLNGYANDDNGTAAYNFVQKGLTNAFSINKVCTDANKCDFPSTFNNMNGEPMDANYLVYFRTVNGDSVAVQYNPDCTGSNVNDLRTSSDISSLVCANLIYDLNGGAKGPNTIGKDMGFITSLLPEYPIVVAPMPSLVSAGNATADQVDEVLDEDPENRLPSMAEIVSINYNRDLIKTMW